MYSTLQLGIDASHSRPSTDPNSELQVSVNSAFPQHVCYSTQNELVWMSGAPTRSLWMDLVLSGDFTDIAVLLPILGATFIRVINLDPFCPNKTLNQVICWPPGHLYNWWWHFTWIPHDSTLHDIWLAFTCTRLDFCCRSNDSIFIMSFSSETSPSFSKALVWWNHKMMPLLSPNDYLHVFATYHPARNGL